MLQFLISRLLSGIIVIISVILLITAIVYVAPVDPTRLTFGQRSDDKTVEQKRAQLGLDQPLYIQMLYYLRDISPVAITDKAYDPGSHGIQSISIAQKTIHIKKPNFRASYQTGSPAIKIVKEAFPLTLILAITALLLASCIGMLLGFIAALNKGKWLDHFIVAFSTIGYSVPSYVSAILLSLFFGFLWSSLTGLNMQGSLYELNDLGDTELMLKNLILPTIALGIRPIAVITQLTRSAVLDIISEDYVRTAKAKGLLFKDIVRKHILKNSMNPIVTTITGWFASLLAGAFFVEFVFNYKGLGFTTVTALLNYDLPVLLAAVMLIASLFVVINIMVDILYRWLTPASDF